MDKNTWRYIRYTIETAVIVGAIVRAIREGKFTDLATHTARWIADNPTSLNLGLKK